MSAPESEPRWTDEIIREALEVMDKRTSSKAHSAFAVMMMMRASYEVTLRANTATIQQQAARIEQLGAELVAAKSEATYWNYHYNEAVLGTDEEALKEAQQR